MRVKTLRIHALVLVLLATLSLQVFANDRNYQKSLEDAWQFGMEVEVIGRSGLRNLMTYLDIAVPNSAGTLIHEKLSADEIDNYLTPVTIESLPAAIREKLLDGEKLEGRIQVPEQRSVEVKAPVVRQTEIILPGNYTERSQGLILPSSATGLVKDSLPPEKTKDLEIPESARREERWKKIEARWRKMAPQERLKLIDINRLNPMTKANLVMDGIVPTEWVHPKEDLSPAVKDLFSRLEWTREQSIIEFRHKLPVKTLDGYLRDLRTFGDLTGVGRFLQDPSKPQIQNTEFSYHVHLSHAKANWKAAPLLNELLLLELQKSGRGAAALQESYGFKNIKTKGLMREVSDGHYELRTHVDAPEEELRKAMESLMQHDLGPLKERIRAHRDRVVNEIVANVSNPEKISTDFEILGRLSGGGWKQPLMNAITAGRSESESKEVIQTLVRNNKSVFGFNFLMPIADRKDVLDNFVRVANSYAVSGSALLYESDLERAGLKSEEIHELTRKHAEEIMDLRSNGANRVSFLATIEDPMFESLWVATVNQADDVRSLERAFGLWRRAGDPARFDQSKVYAARKIEQRLREMSLDLPSYLKGLGRLRALAGTMGSIKEFARAVLDRVKADPKFAVASDLEWIYWAIPFADESDIAFLRKAAAADNRSTALFRKLIDLGDPIDEKAFRNLLKHESITTVREVVPSFTRVLNEGSKKEKAKILKFVRSGLLDMFPLAGGMSRSQDIELTERLIQEIVGAEKPHPKDLAFIQKIVEREAQGMSVGSPDAGITGNTIVDLAEKKQIHPEWRALALELFKKPSTVVSNEAFPKAQAAMARFLRREMASGSPNEKLAHETYEAIVNSPKSYEILRSAEKILKLDDLNYPKIEKCPGAFADLLKKLASKRR